jgi:hypothetical protein
VAALSNLKADAADDVRKLRDELGAALDQLGDAVEARIATWRGETEAGTRALAEDTGGRVKTAADGLAQSMQLALQHAIQQVMEAQRERFEAHGRLACAAECHGKIVVCGQHRLESGKMTAFEEDLLIPMSVRGPGVRNTTTWSPRRASTRRSRVGGDCSQESNVAL